MRKRCVLCALVAVLVLSVAGMAFGETPEESLRKNFPQLKFEKISPTPIKGVYEVTLSNNILYYVPETQNIIAGNIFTKDNRNLTQERMMEIQKKNLEIVKKKQKEIPLDKAVKIGSGPHTVIEFSNPDCSYCRKASAFFAQRQDITRYVFFVPIFPNSIPKIKHILCAKDPAKAYEEAMTGRLEDGKVAACAKKEVDDLQVQHARLAEKLGIDSTPFFFIDGEIVQGADMPAIEKLLGKEVTAK